MRNMRFLVGRAPLVALTSLAAPACSNSNPTMMPDDGLHRRPATWRASPSTPIGANVRRQQRRLEGVQGLHPADRSRGPTASCTSQSSGEANAHPRLPLPSRRSRRTTRTCSMVGSSPSREYLVALDRRDCCGPTPIRSRPIQSQHGGAVAALATGPFIVDLHKGGVIGGKGRRFAGASHAASGVIANQNLNGGASFDSRP